MSIINVYADRPTKTVITVLSLLFGALTIIKFQSLQVATLTEAFEILTSEQGRVPLLLTWFFNLASVAILCGIGISWIKEFRLNSYYYEDVLLNNLVCIMTGLLLIAFSAVFIFFILNKMLGIVILAGFAWLLLSDSGKHKSNSGKRK